MKNYTFMRFPVFCDKALTLSYDDGLIHDRRLIEIMSEYGLKGTFNLNSSNHEKPVDYHILKEEAVDLYLGSGNEVAVHGYKHLSLTEVDSAAATAEIVNDRIKLENIFGTVIKGMAYANGSFDNKVAEIVKNCGIKYARTTVSTRRFSIPENWLQMPATCHHNDGELMNLAKQFIEGEPNWYYWNNNPKLFYLWGHSYEYFEKDNWNVLEEFAKYTGRRSGVWYATNGEIYEYVRAFDSLEFSVESKYVYNPSATDVYIDCFGKQYVIPAGKTTELK